MTRTKLIGSANALQTEYVEQMYAAVTAGIKELLESKHLYQSVTVDHKSIHARVAAASASKDLLDEFLSEVDRPLLWPWTVDAPTRIPRFRAGPASTEAPTWQAPDVKLFCNTCGRLEPFNLTNARTLLRSEIEDESVRRNGVNHQAYVLQYLCQSCKSVPELFLVKRQNLKFTLAGRAPMEHVPVPDEFPKPIREFYSGGVVAFQSGQVLAALFMLRTACEQWTRRFALPTDRADVANDKYMTSLPADFKTRFPSLAKIYADLSSAIHAARADEALYLNTLADLQEHFKARALFKLPDSREGATK
jgi:hypothetical protein